MNEDSSHKGSQFGVVPQKQRLMKMAPMVAIGIVLVGLGFAGGMQYQKGHTTKTVAPSNQPASVGPNGAGTRGGGLGGGFRGLGGGFGQVTTISTTSITVQNTRSGADITYDITAQTTVTNNGQPAAVGDIKAGDIVLVRPDSTNSKQADTILLNPQVPTGRGGSAPALNTN